MAMNYEIELSADGTVHVFQETPNGLVYLTGAELEAWLADMEQRIAQARSHT